MSRAFLVTLVLLLMPALIVRAGNGNGNAYARGKKTGSYTATIVGSYTGSGTATVSSTTVSLKLTVTSSSGASYKLNFNNVPLTNDRFAATSNAGGVAFTLTGRVDLPAATDPDQTAAQAVTGRLTAVITDPAGNGALLVAIQDAASRGGGNGNGNGNGGG